MPRHYGHLRQGRVLRADPAPAAASDSARRDRVAPILFPSRALRLLLLVGVCAAQPAWAAKVALRIKAVNPLNSPQMVVVRSTLPEGVTSNDVVDLDGLELGYDVQNGVYYVHKEVRLGPMQTQDFEVGLRDVWVIAEAELDSLLLQARTLTEKLAGTELADSSRALFEQVTESLGRIRKTQAEGAIRPGVTPVEHIAAYDANVKLLGRVRRDIGHIENLVMETGQDPGRLVGEDSKALRLRRDIELPAGDYRTATIRISVQNTSPTEKRLVDVRQALAPELTLDDVLDAAGLSVGSDPETGACYVYRSGVEVEPNDTIAFDVKVRDKWNINGPRIQALSANASNVLARIVKREKYESIEKMLAETQTALAAIAAERGPQTLSPEYVAFYRDQARRLDELEQRINRVRAALQPIEKTRKYGFRVRAPSMRTTWLIIYAILGFLALMSLLFFLRWYGKTREDAMWEALDRSRRDGGGEGER